MNDRDLKEFKEAHALIGKLILRAKKHGRFTDEDQLLFRLSKVMFAHGITSDMLPKGILDSNDTREMEKMNAFIGACMEIGYHLALMEREEKLN